MDSTHTKSIDPLAIEALYRPCNLDDLGFDTTDELEPLADHLGQDRAVEALRFGMGIRHDGYNMFLLGSAGVGKHELLAEILDQGREPLSSLLDWCYVNNFDQPHRPIMLALPAGTGRAFREDMLHTVEDLLISIPAAFQSEEYQSQVQDLAERYTQREQEAFNELSEKAKDKGVALIQTPNGYTLAPTRDDKILSPADFETLPDAEKQRQMEIVESLKEELKAIVRQLPQWVKEGREKMRDLNREYSKLVIDQLFQDLKLKYESLPEVLNYLEAVKTNVIENVDAFRQTEGEGDLPAEMAHTKAREFRHYSVNVLVDNSEQKYAPVVHEDNPSFINLVGRIEHLSQYGTLITDFNLIQPGALHQANGGYLVLDAAKVLTNPFAWDALKRILKAREIRIQSLEQMFSFASTIQLEPEPIPLNTKVILTGDRHIYYLLQQFDPEFGQLFKVAADMSEDTAIEEKSVRLFARLVKTLQTRHQLLPLERGAVARVIEQCSRNIEDAEKLSLHIGSLSDLLRESDYLARQNNAETITRADVGKAVEAGIFRVDQLRERSHEHILREIQLVDTEGAKIAQVNGLSVYQLGNYAFGKPTRITATTRLGSGGVIDIEREAKLGGRIHSKGVMIISSFLASRYSADRPHSLAATLAFEQSYGGVEGDSASVAELAALISSLSRIPVYQHFAATGSVNQLGQVQAIGGVNEKVEGFFDICSARGLNGKQGVIIPSANRKHLMLREDVVAAARERQFAIYAVEYIDEALEILLGTPAGEKDTEGNYPKGSINGKVMACLDDWTAKRKNFSSSEHDDQPGRGDDE
ncbi:Lon protease family protein [Kineobactrum salinum]|uniref:endopeptidase La n=1 Tax=Kineobactrum salinum TaxID=2708301 RepID=A0A6C0U1J7_9GAMM|nr:ATP-binding protein [Kineobactrum salinum]QIB64205.1 AAA family ATPase [Kineobactrum salinum]